jgi:tRNA (adenine22-N1)-methyltransferase
MIKLSKRLQVVADHVPRGCVLADIGSDHALLPVYLAVQGIVRRALAGEVNPGPFDAAKRQVQSAGLTHLIDVREGDGLAILEQDDVDVITICGMGGQLIVSILEQGKPMLTRVQKLILQPNVGEDAVRRWLEQAKWQLTSETIIEEEEHFYEILVAERRMSKANVDAIADAGINVVLTTSQVDKVKLYEQKVSSSGCVISPSMLYLMGPYFIERGEELWVRKWQAELTKLHMISQQIGLSQSEEAKHKARLVQQQMTEIEEVISCTQKVKRLLNGSSN